MGKGAGKGAFTEKSGDNLASLEKADEWVSKLDYEAFKKDVHELGKRLEASQGPEDVAHLNKIVRWSNTFATIGLLTLWWSPNFITVCALSLWTFSRWTMVAHHVCHGGYDKTETNGRYNRFKFAVGTLFNRLSDWFDWMLPEAWNVEHNNLHHYALGEIADPDLVQNNLTSTRQAKTPLVFKYLSVVVAMFTWKWFYYAPNTYKELKLSKMRTSGEKVEGDFHSPFTVLQFLDPECPKWFKFSEFFTWVIGPYLIFHFIVLPMPFLVLFPQEVYFYNAVVNLILAELLTNLHSFVVIVTNHAGDDLYCFENGCRPLSASFYLRAIISSVNFSCGNDYVDFMHGWLNYQVEHHMWPKLSMLSYQRAQPLVEAICKKHGVPYLKHNVFYRVKQTVDIMVGNSSMRNFPSQYDHTPDIVKSKNA